MIQVKVFYGQAASAPQANRNKSVGVFRFYSYNEEYLVEKYSESFQINDGQRTKDGLNCGKIRMLLTCKKKARFSYWPRKKRRNLCAKLVAMNLLNGWDAVQIAAAGTKWWRKL